MIDWLICYNEREITQHFLGFPLHTLASTYLDAQSVTLKDGTPVIIRPIRPEDADHLQDTFDHLSIETIYLRFFSFKKELPDEEARYLATVDYNTRMAFVGECKKDGKDIVIGVARYALLDTKRPKIAESAVVVQDEYQGRGLGKLLLRRLVIYAHTKGIHHLRGNLQVGNNRMLDLVKNSGLPYKTRFVDGIWQVDIDIAHFKHDHT
ncbi:MAG TPA: GNAT family N-acetyltransferase [Anaerolineales bacterium]|nr:GNAT family N-acetyltransferase [Anaerolineales bacterium]